MVIKQKLQFDFVTPGLNGKDGLINEHFRAKKKRQESIVWAVKAKNPDKHKGKVIITYTRASVVAPDWDNLCASFKHWGDALVKCGVIEDDKPSIILEFKPRWEKAKNNKSLYTIIEIKDL